GVGGTEDDAEQHPGEDGADRHLREVVLADVRLIGLPLGQFVGGRVQSRLFLVAHAVLPSICGFVYCSPGKSAPWPPGLSDCGGVADDGVLHSRYPHERMDTRGTALTGWRDP